jgi:hypothetical protein
MGSERNSTALREITRWVKGNNGCFDLARFQRDVLKAGGRVVKHARRLVLTVARVVVSFWRRLIDCLRRWQLPDRFPAPRGPRTRTWRPPPRHAYLHEVRRL